MEERAPHPGGILKTKAAESGVMLPWAQKLLADFGGGLPMLTYFTAAGTAMARWLEVTRTQPDILSPAACQELKDNAQRHLLHSQRALISFTPKHHFFAELTLQACWHGNPKNLATREDESLNLHLRDAAAAAHRARQEERVFHWLSLQGTLGTLPNIFGAPDAL